MTGVRGRPWKNEKDSLGTLFSSENEEPSVFNLLLVLRVFFLLSKSGDEPSVMFVNCHDIRKIGLHHLEYTRVVDQLRNALALDVDIGTGKIFWADLVHQAIFR